MGIKLALLAVITAIGLAAICVAIAPLRTRRAATTGPAATISASPSAGDPAACAARCEREGRCRAWSFSYPRIGRRRDVLAQEPGDAAVEDPAASPA